MFVFYLLIIQHSKLFLSFYFVETEEEPRMISPLPGEAEDNPVDTEIHVHQTQLDMCVMKHPDGSDLPANKEIGSEVSVHNNVRK